MEGERFCEHCWKSSKEINHIGRALMQRDGLLEEFPNTTTYEPKGTFLHLTLAPGEPNSIYMIVLINAICTQTPAITHHLSKTLAQQ